MTNEEAIAFLEQYINSEVYTEKCISAHEMAITALRSAHAGEAMGYHFPAGWKIKAGVLSRLIVQGHGLESRFFAGERKA